MEYPDELTDALAEILGRPNFMCSPLAHLFRTAEGAEIAERAEAEQAYIIHWMIGLYLRCGPGWRAEAARRIEIASEKLRKQRDGAA